MENASENHNWDITILQLLKRKRPSIQSVIEDVNQPEVSYTAGGNISQYTLLGILFGIIY